MALSDISNSSPAAPRTPAQKSPGAQSNSLGDSNTPQTLSKKELKSRLLAVTAELERLKLDQRRAHNHQDETAELERLKLDQRRAHNHQDETPDKFRCPITFARMRSPVVCADGHTFERSAISKWLTTSGTNPSTGTQLTHRMLNPSLVLKNEIREFEAASGRSRPPASPPPPPAEAAALAEAERNAAMQQAVHAMRGLLQQARELEGDDALEAERQGHAAILKAAQAAAQEARAERLRRAAAREEERRVAAAAAAAAPQ
jgi:hypothetical protein